MSSCSYGLLLLEEVIEIKPVSSLMRTSFLWPWPCASHRRPPCCWRAAAAGSEADNYNAICSHTATPTKCLAGTRQACVCVRRYRQHRWELMATLIGVNWRQEGRKQEEVLKLLIEWHHFLCFLTWTCSTIFLSQTLTFSDSYIFGRSYL